jgi:hypothetical protein
MLLEERMASFGCIISMTAISRRNRMGKLRLRIDYFVSCIPRVAVKTLYTACCPEFQSMNFSRLKYRFKTILLFTFIPLQLLVFLYLDAGQ